MTYFGCNCLHRVFFEVTHRTLKEKKTGEEDNNVYEIKRNLAQLRQGDDIFDVDDEGTNE